MILSSMNLMVITYWDFNDALIQTYTLPYVRIIRKQLTHESTIFLVTLDKTKISAVEKELVKQNLKTQGIEWISFQYVPFGIFSMIKWVYMLAFLLLKIWRNDIRYIHCWATPAGAAGYILSILSRRNLIIDSYEPHAEAMVENGTWKKDSLAFKILFWLERKQSEQATSVIAAAKGMEAYAKEKYRVTFDNFFVKPACVDINLFNVDKRKDSALLEELNLQNKIICVYAGKFGGIYLKHQTFDFFKSASDFWGDRFRVILLSPHKENEIEEFCLEAGLDRSIIILRFVPHAEVPLYMGLADFAITPVRPVPTKRYCTPIKDGEYWALGLPVVIPSNISDDSEIIESNDVGAILHHLDQNHYHQAIRKIDDLLKTDYQKLSSKIHGLALQYRSFQIAESVYNSVYSGIDR